MNENALPWIIGIIAGFVAVLFLFIGSKLGESNTKQEAIRAGAAYYTNDASGMSQFKWKVVKP